MMDIEKINKRHFIKTDMYYRVELGLSSKLLKYENGIFHLEVIVGKKWSRNLNAAAAEMAYAWRETNAELSNSIGCKVYLVDLKNNPFKKYLVNSDILPQYDAKKGVLFYRQHLN
jgi:hypothetical protein